MIAFIGSGPHNLAALAFLLQANPGLRSEVAVFDPSGAWLTRWNRQMEGQEIVHLRSSSVHHPDPDPLALRRFAKGRFDEFYPPYSLPGTALFREFCDDVVQRYNVSSLVRPHQVTGLSKTVHGLRLTLDSGKTFDARAVVAALGGGLPVRPEWAQGIQSPTFLHSQDVKLAELAPSDGTIAIIGGGLTAGHLAVGALRRGWRVDLVTRRPIQYKLFDSAPGWIGPKYMTMFRGQMDWRRRRKMIAKARGGGAMTDEVRESLQPFLRTGQLKVHARCQVQLVKLVDQTWQLDCGWGRTLLADRVWLCTGSRLDVQRHPLFSSLSESFPLQVVDGFPVLENDCSWPGLPLYLMGMPTALRLGPTARNFPGARYAASRIAHALTGVLVPPH